MRLWLHISLFISAYCSVYSYKYGEAVSNCPNNRQDLRRQICPEGGNAYVRLKTYDGRYVFAYPYDSSDNSYLRTKCCGKYAEPVTEPGVRTTFKVHCGSYGGSESVRFEILRKANHRVHSSDNRPSGYFFYADNYNSMWANDVSSPNARETNFRLHRWRGPIVGIEIVNSRRWISFSDTSMHGYLSVWSRDKKLSDHPKPTLYDTFTIEIVPKECADVVLVRDKIQAAPTDASPSQCEVKPDRCYWDTRLSVSKAGPKCYYKKGSMCFQPGSKENCQTSTSNAADCEAANCCYDYRYNSCYKGKSIDQVQN